MAKQSEKARVDHALAQVAMARVHPDTQLSADAVKLLTGLSRPSLYRHAAAGTFPRPVARGRWHGGQVLEHLAKTARQPAAPEHEAAQA